jgi:hypothetical protein
LISIMCYPIPSVLAAQMRRSACENFRIEFDFCTTGVSCVLLPNG